MLKVFDRIVRLADPYAVPDNGVYVHTDFVAEEHINFGFSAAIAAHQPPQRSHLVIGVMVNVHIGVGLPAGVGPIDKTTKGLPFLIAGMRPPVVEQTVIERKRAKEIFQPAFHQRIALHVKKNIARRCRRQQCQSATL